MFKLILAGLGVVAAYIFLVTGAGAQYPTPVGSVTSSGSNTEVTCVALDVGGNPIAGQFIVFEITQNPGGAQLLKHQGISGPDGSVTVPLDPGTEPGQIEVTCTAGDLTSTFVTEVKGAITPPATGDGGLASARSGMGAVGAIVAIFFLAGLFSVSSRRRA